MQVYPSIACFCKQYVFFFTVKVERAKLQCLLVACLPLVGKGGAIWHPLTAGKINVFVFT